MSRLPAMIKLRTLLVLSCSAIALLGCSREPGSRSDAADAAASSMMPLKLAGSAELRGYKGDFDHFDIDQKDHRVFLAGEESAELEVFDQVSGRVIRRMK